MTRHVLTDGEAITFTPWPHQTPSGSLHLLRRSHAASFAYELPSIPCLPGQASYYLETQSRNRLLPSLSIFALTALEYNLLI